MVRYWVTHCLFYFTFFKIADFFFEILTESCLCELDDCVFWIIAVCIHLMWALPSWVGCLWNLTFKHYMASSSNWVNVVPQCLV